MTHRFLNSYHFVPTSALDLPGWRGRIKETSADDFISSGPHRIDGHAVYDPNGFSGSMQLRIRLEGPTVVGGAHIPADPAQSRPYRIVFPYRFKGKPAISATSIKGMLSSVLEQASFSRYRVLTNNRLTVGTYDRNLDRSVHLDAGNAYDYFNELQQPISADSNVASIADVLLGFVRKKDKRSNKSTMKGPESFAGKLRISVARLTPEFDKKADEQLFANGDWPVQHNDLGPNVVHLTRLKEQGEPMKTYVGKVGDHSRSATPNLYFQKRSETSAYVDKESFAQQKSRTYEPKGRKTYLHHANLANAQPYRTRSSVAFDDGAERKAAVRPLLAGVEFDFEICFDNLSEFELNLLCYAVCPSRAFRHKIGLAKALGLGSIHLMPLGLHLVDRKARYLEGNPLNSQSTTKDRAEDSEKIRDRATIYGTTFLQKFDPVAKRALEAIGETHPFAIDGRVTTAPVSWTPLMTERFELSVASDIDPDKWAAEDRAFGWHAENAKPANQQALPPVTARIPELQTINEIPVRAPLTIAAKKGTARIKGKTWHVRPESLAASSLLNGQTQVEVSMLPAQASNNPADDRADTIGVLVGPAGELRKPKT